MIHELKNRRLFLKEGAGLASLSLLPTLPLRELLCCPQYQNIPRIIDVSIYSHQPVQDWLQTKLSKNQFLQMAPSELSVLQGPSPFSQGRSVFKGHFSSLYSSLFVVGQTQKNFLHQSISGLEQALKNRPLTTVERENFNQILGQLLKAEGPLKSLCQSESFLQNDPALVLQTTAQMITAAVMCDSVRTFSVPIMDSTFKGSLENGLQLEGLGQSLEKSLISPLVQGLSLVDPASGKTYLHNSLIRFHWLSGSKSTSLS